MKNRLAWFLFAVSLAANIFFAAGVGYTVYQDRRAADSPDARVDMVAERLGLDEAQHEALGLLRERSAMRRPGLRQADRPVRAAILKQLTQPEFDRDMIMGMLVERDEERRPYFAEYSEDLHGFLVTLTAEQREKFLAMAREPGFVRRVYGGERKAGKE
jgi:LTXXQ motif family protein